MKVEAYICTCMYVCIRCMYVYSIYSTDSVSKPCENTLANTKYITFLRKDTTFQVSNFTTCHLLVDQKP